MVEEVFGSEKGFVVRGREDQGIVASGGGGVLAQLDGLAGGGGAAADNERGGGRVGVECLSGGGGDQVAFFTAEVDGFAVAALHDETGHAGLGEVGGVLGGGGQVEVFVGRGEEGDGWDVDAGFEGAGGNGHCGGGDWVGDQSGLGVEV